MLTTSGDLTNPAHLLYVPWDHDVTDPQLLGPDFVSEMFSLLAVYFGLPREEWPAIMVYWLSGMQFGRTQLHAHIHIRIAQRDATEIRFRNLLTERAPL